jgi:hypothetical protein
MRMKLICQSVTENNGITRLRLAGDDGYDRTDVLINAARRFFNDGEEPKEDMEYYIHITQATKDTTQE